MAGTTAAAATCNPAEPERPNLAGCLSDKAAEELDQKHPWYSLPKLLGLAELIAIRCGRRIAMTPRGCQPRIPCNRRHTTPNCSPNGSWNDLGHPEMGMTGTRVRAQRPARGHRARSQPDSVAQPARDKPAANDK